MKNVFSRRVLAEENNKSAPNWRDQDIELSSSSASFEEARFGGDCLFVELFKGFLIRISFEK